MKTTTIIFLCAILCIQFSNGAEKNQTREQIVAKAIEEASKAYDEKVNALGLNGAQSAKYKSRGPSKSTKRTQEIGRLSAIYRSAFTELTSKSSMDRETVLSILRDNLPAQCQVGNVTCDSNAKYRTVDGTCNNLENPHWGAAGRPLARMLPPAYEGESDPRGGFEESILPLARNVTLTVHSGDGSSYEPNVTHMIAQFGQFLDHDITLTPVESLKCCENPDLSENCWKITVPPEDEHFGGKVSCLDFVRSTPACFPFPGIDHREQFNDLTAFIDASNVYGSDNKTFHDLRTHMGGLLVENKAHPGFLPWNSDVNPGGSDTTVIAGDIRANEMPGLTVMHVLFMREHNRIAKALSTLRPNWDDERLFEETRRIVGAELQQITYQEFLPAILGDKAMKDYDLQLPFEPTSHTEYDPTLNPTIYNAFATAAYRFGHTLVNGLIQLFLGDSIVGEYHVRDNYLISDQVLQNGESGSGFDLILNGLIRQRAQAFDGEIHEDMTNYLFADKVTMIGEDLAARNIQRGRDHGIPSYNEFRKFCRIPPLTDWESRPSDISETSWEKLRQVYDSPDDIDLYTGGLSQIPVPTALSGPTFVCLQGIQFKALKNGDRFFFTHATAGFTPDQLNQLRKRTLGDIICENSELNEAAMNVFYLTSQLNPMLPCDKSRTMDLSKFVDDDVTTTPPTPTTTPSGSTMASFSLYLVSTGILLLLFNITYKPFF